MPVSKFRCDVHVLLRNLRLSNATCPPTNRPKLAEVISFCQTLGNKRFHLPVTSNKGLPGLLLENFAGIPSSSACMDCRDGELKLYPVKRLKRNGKSNVAGDLVPKETVAITMMKPEQLLVTPWNYSHVREKIEQVLFIAYYRDNDYITFPYMHHMSFYNPEHYEYYKTFARDYYMIKEHYRMNGTISGDIGKYIQYRTKGRGGSAPKTRAFYFRTNVMNSLEKIELNDSDSVSFHDLYH